MSSLLRFEAATGCGVLINTSFNVRGEPICLLAGRCAPGALSNTEMDHLIIGNFVLDRAAQPRRQTEWRVTPQPGLNMRHARPKPSQAP